jgi:hypothetical protein
MRSYLLWCAGVFAFIVGVLRLESGEWPDRVGLIALIMALPLVGAGLWIRYSKGEAIQKRAEQAGRDFGERHRDKVQNWLGRN